VRCFLDYCKCHGEDFVELVFDLFEYVLCQFVNLVIEFFLPVDIFLILSTDPQGGNFLLLGRDMVAYFLFQCCCPVTECIIGKRREQSALLLYLINERIDFLEVTFLLVSEEHREDFVNDAHLLSF